MTRAWLWIGLGLLAAGCSKPAPKLAYVKGSLDEPACRQAPGTGCATLSLPEHPMKPQRVSMKGVVQMVVSLPQQQLYAFRDGDLVAISRVSTGKKGHETPAGHFRILEKAVIHHSNKYDNAPMPYMQRLTEGGIALHAGHVPGYPASHGCIRLPAGFAQQLYRMTSFRSTVVVTRRVIAGEGDALGLAASATPTFIPPTPPVTVPPDFAGPLPPTASLIVAVQPKLAATAG